MSEDENKPAGADGESSGPEDAAETEFTEGGPAEHAEPDPTEPESADAGPTDQAEPEPTEPESADDGSPAPEPEASPPEAPEPVTGAEEAGVPGADLEPIAIEQEENLSAEERARREAEAEEERARREAELAAESVEDEVTVREPARLDPDSMYRATGKRKNAIARVVLRPGTGQVEVNGREMDDYFPRHVHQSMVRQPLAATGYDSAVDVTVRTHGGGVAGQAVAVRHGIARALTEVDAELRGDLKRRGYLTRDSRAKERRKAGLRKARKRPQFSKR